jgi:hypothetical protein
MRQPKAPIAKIPVADDASVSEIRAERQALREIRSGLTEIIAATPGLIDGLAGAPIATVRTTLQESLRRQRELARAIKSLSRVVAP